jgi:hypothetical protein
MCEDRININRWKKENLLKSPSIISHQISQSKEGGFIANYADGVIRIEGKSRLECISGESQLKSLIGSGHWNEFLGESFPKYHLRPLWIGSEMHKILFSNVKTNKFEKISNKIYGLGYNALIFGGHELNNRMRSKQTFQELKDLLNILKPLWVSEKIKLIVSFESSPSFNSQVMIEDLIHSLPALDYLLWCSQYNSEVCGELIDNEAKTFGEKLQDEMKMAESILHHRLPLIFYIPFQAGLRAWDNPTLLNDLCLAAGKHTCIAFPAVAGPPAEDHLVPHPFWEELRVQRIRISTPLLPVINSGNFNQGEGLWPSVAYDLFDSYLTRATHKHNFAGFISLTDRLPAEGGFLECNLWIAGQMQWRNMSSEVLIDTWLKSNYSSIDYRGFKSLLKQTRSLIVELNYLKTLQKVSKDSLEEICALVEFLLANLKIIELKAHKLFKENLYSCHLLQAQFKYFVCDIRRILNYFVQQHCLTNFKLEECDLQESFWTKVEANRTISLLKVPKKGEEKSSLYEIYHKNYLSLTTVL